ncbi:hypothetical protein [Nostocoides veronense]|uniref:Uncharacterized protein n=1 Tax=Nostocoides veronense TaxID=330836 RepID=A0ABP4Y6S7_9MICO
MSSETPSESRQPAGASEPSPDESAAQLLGDPAPSSSTPTNESRAVAESSGDGAAADVTAPASKRPVKPAKPQIETIEALLTEAFETKPEVLLRFAPDKLKKLPVVDDQIMAQTEVVVRLSKSDPTLNGPFKLLQYVASRGVQLGRGTVAPLDGVLERLRDLALLALGQHPVFRVWSDELADPRWTPELTVEVVREAVQKVSRETLGLPEEQFKQSDKDRLLRNAISCLSLVRVLQRDWTLDDFIDETQAAIWSPNAPKEVGLEKAAGLLSASRDAGLIGLVAGAYEARVRARDHEIQRLKHDAERETRRVEILESQKLEASMREEALTARAEAFSAEIVRLRKELDAERDNRVVDKSHATDDYETLRTRVIRRLTGEIDLLTDALHALRNGASPVAEEFLDRSLLALSREVEQLKDAAGGLK